jgi:hypothetical protein
MAQALFQSFTVGWNGESLSQLLVGMAFILTLLLLRFSGLQKMAQPND